MTMYSQDLLNKWSAMDHHAGGYIRIDENHPLEWYIGYEGIDHKSLLLVTTFEPKAISSSKSILVSSAVRSDDNWALMFKLIRAEQKDVYIRLHTYKDSKVSMVNVGSK